MREGTDRSIPAAGEDRAVPEACPDDGAVSREGEIVRAARAIAEAAKAGTLDPATLDEPGFARFLATADMPDPDLVIRTSGEQRLSNFLLWQAAYAEFVFLDALWPDFDEAHFAAALREYAERERRFGARPG